MDPALFLTDLERKPEALHALADHLEAQDPWGVLPMASRFVLLGMGSSFYAASIAAAQDSFLDSYRTTLGSLGSLELLDERLLVPLRLQQECREFLYAVRHLPHWRYVPDAALLDLLPEE